MTATARPFPPLSDFPPVSQDTMGDYADLFSKLANKHFPTWTYDAPNVDPVFIGRAAWRVANHLTTSRRPRIQPDKPLLDPPNSEQLNEGHMIAASIMFFTGVRLSQEAFRRLEASS